MKDQNYEVNQNCNQPNLRTNGTVEKWTVYA